MKNPKFQVFKSQSNQQYYFRLKAKNGEIILASEGYTRKLSCIKGITSVKTHALNLNCFIRKDQSYNYTFNLRANNHKIIGRSENYTTAQARDKGIHSVRRNAIHAGIQYIL